MDIRPIKTTGYKNRAKKRPTDRIVRLLEIQLENNSVGFASLKIMDQLMKHQNSIQDESPLDEGRLGRRNHPMGNRGEPKLANRVCPFNFRDKGQNRKVNTRDINST